MSEDITIVGELERVLESSLFQTFVIVTASDDRYRITRKHQAAIESTIAA